LAYRSKSFDSQDLKKSPVRTLLIANLNRGATSVRTLLTASLNRGTTSVRTPLAVHALSATGPQQQGGATPTMGMDGSPHGGTPARESLARSIGCGGH